MSQSSKSPEPTRSTAPTTPPTSAVQHRRVPPKVARPSWSPRNAPTNERYVEIQLSKPNGTDEETVITAVKSFPLSLLLLYSKRARDELPKLGEDNGPLLWKLPSLDYSNDPRGLNKVLRWFQSVLPAKGYSPRYAGHPQLDTLGVRDLDPEQLVRFLLAMHTLELAAPLDAQQVVPRLLNGHIAETGVSPDGLTMLWWLEKTPYEGVFNFGVHRAVDYYDPNNTESHADQDEIDYMVQTRVEYPELDKIMVKVEEGKKQRLERKEQEWKDWEKRVAGRKSHQDYLERKARREERAAADQERYERFQARIDGARDGQVALKPHEVSVILRRS